MGFQLASCFTEDWTQGLQHAQHQLAVNIPLLPTCLQQTSDLLIQPHNCICQFLIMSLLLVLHLRLNPDLDTHWNSPSAHVFVEISSRLQVCKCSLSKVNSLGSPQCTHPHMGKLYPEAYSPQIFAVWLPWLFRSSPGKKPTVFSWPQETHLSLPL